MAVAWHVFCLGLVMRGWMSLVVLVVDELQQRVL